MSGLSPVQLRPLAVRDPCRPLPVNPLPRLLLGHSINDCPRRHLRVRNAGEHFHLVTLQNEESREENREKESRREFGVKGVRRQVSGRKSQCEYFIH